MTLIPALAQANGSSEAATTGLDILAVLLMVMGVLLLGMIFTLSIRRKVARRQEATPTPREQIERIRGGGGPASNVDLASEEARILSTVQRLASQMDLKAERLEQLLQEAGRQIEELQALLAQSAVHSGDQGPGPPGPGISVPAEPPSASRARVSRGGGEREVRPETESSSAKEFAVAGTDRRHVRSEAPSAPRPDPLTAEIYRLADSGRDPVEIARELEEQIGKVELILALRGSEEP